MAPVIQAAWSERRKATAAAISAAWAHGPKRVTVQTCTLDHPAALPLYQKLGFTPVAQKKEVVRPLTFAERSASVMRG